MLKSKIFPGIVAGLFMFNLIATVFAENNSELIQFINNNTYKNVINYEDTDEEFQILVRIASGDEIKALRDIIKNPDSKEDQKVLALRALGTIKNYESIDVIKTALLNNNKENIVYMAAWALINIGGESNYRFIVSNFNHIENVIKDKKLIFSILLALSDKYKSAYELKYDTKFLNEPPKDSFDTIFLFTVFGRNAKSEKTLINCLSSDNNNVKLNAVKILGEWYASPASVKHFKQMLVNEKTLKIRKAIIKGLETIANKSSKDVLSYIMKHPLNSEEKEFAEEALNIIKDLETKVKKVLNAGFKPQRQVFKKELSKLMNSKGNYGSYVLLAKNAIFSDIFLLERLRETIMLRTSVDAMKDYAKVTKIITELRIKKELESSSNK